MERMKAEDCTPVEQRVFGYVTKQPSANRSHPSPLSPTATQDPFPLDWWTAVKNKFTPTKDPLKPAQQSVQGTESRKKENKERKTRMKHKPNGSKDSGKEWPASPERKYLEKWAVGHVRALEGRVGNAQRWPGTSQVGLAVPPDQSTFEEPRKSQVLVFRG